jgi:tetratricopeptide (TPR) repeat protein
MASLIPRTLTRKFTPRNTLSSVYKHPSQFITYHSFAIQSQRQMRANARSKVVIITKNRYFSTEQPNQSSSKNNDDKSSPENITPKQTSIFTSEPLKRNKPSGTNEFSTKKTNDYRKPTLPAFPLVLIFTASAITCLGLYKYFFSAVYKYPEEIRKNLRKGLYYQNYRNDPNLAVNYYQAALNEAFNNTELDNASPEVTGIMIQLGSLYEDLGRIRDATNVFTMAYDAIVIPNNTSVKLDEKTKLRSIGLAQKLGDLHQSLKQDEQAEKYYVWSVEQLLQLQSVVVQSNNDSSSRNSLFSKKLDMRLPPWMTFTNLGASLEALAAFYSSRQKYA